ncbi:relaxase domain-containing protein [Streptomyces sp. NPDC001552]|uniref:relaxase domain-containing protein n=1 Tax=Streptomyces sp. NPDC001552 TaxID=3364587 RepID=UPI0036ABB95D
MRPRHRITGLLGAIALTAATLAAAGPAYAAAPPAADPPAGGWMGRGLAVLGLAPGEEVTEAQLRNLFGERGRHPYADRIEADRLARGESPKEAFKAGALGRRVMVTGVDFVFRPQPTIYLLWALGDEATRRVIEAAHERAIVRVLEWIEDEVAVIRYGKDGTAQRDIDSYLAVMLMPQVVTARHAAKCESAARCRYPFGTGCGRHRVG